MRRGECGGRREIVVSLIYDLLKGKLVGARGFESGPRLIFRQDEEVELFGGKRL